MSAKKRLFNETILRATAKESTSKLQAIQKEGAKLKIQVKKEELKSNCRRIYRETESIFKKSNIRCE